MIFGIPIFSYFFLTDYYDELEEKEFKTKYIALYKNVDTRRKSDHGKQIPYYYTTLYCLIRILLAYTTVYWSQYMIVNQLAYYAISMGAIGYYLVYKPLRGKVHNYVEIINSCFLLLGSYFMVIFSNWVPDIEIRYTFGTVFTYMTGFFIATNFIFICMEIYYHIVLLKRKRDYKKRMKKQIEAYEPLIEKCLYITV